MSHIINHVSVKQEIPSNDILETVEKCILEKMGRTWTVADRTYSWNFSNTWSIYTLTPSDGMAWVVPSKSRLPVVLSKN